MAGPDHAEAHDPGHEAHGHAGHAHAAPKDFGKAFAIGIALNLGFVVIEVVYGLLANSIALVADAGHNLGDVLGLVMAWVATVLARRAPSKTHTYGLRRGTILAALANAVLLLVAVGAILVEGVRRLIEPGEVASVTVMIVAAVGIAVNGVTAWLFASGRKGDINLRGAFLHMAYDALVSVGVVAAGAVILVTGWTRIDPLVSLAVAGVILWGTWGLLRDSVNLALDAVPGHIEPTQVEAYLAALPGVVAVHDLHIWGMSTTEAALTVHLVKPDASIDDALLSRINRDMHAKFAIDHCTVQFERGDEAHPCGQAATTVV